MMGRRDGPAVEMEPFAFALEPPFVTSFSFGIVEYWESGNPESICLWWSASKYTLIVPVDRRSDEKK